jgi:hypothetical protein
MRVTRVGFLVFALAAAAILTVGSGGAVGQTANGSNGQSTEDRCRSTFKRDMELINQTYAQGIKNAKGDANRLRHNEDWYQSNKAAASKQLSQCIALARSQLKKLPGGRIDDNRVHEGGNTLIKNNVYQKNPVRGTAVVRYKMRRGKWVPVN